MTPVSPFEGIGYLLRGFRLLTQPGLKRFVIIPLILNILFFSLLIGSGLFFINLLTDYYIHLLPSWLHWLKYLVWIIFFTASSIIILYFFTMLTNLMSAPFNSLLSEKVEEILTGKKPSPEHVPLRKEIPLSIKRELDKIKYYATRALFLFILFFIPGINLIISVLWLIFGCWMMSVEYADYPLDNRKMAFRELHLYLKQHCLTSLGFGFAIMVASSIPLVNFAVVPAAVIGGTIMWIEKQEKTVMKG